MKPTKLSLDEASKAAGLKSFPILFWSIEAHALTLDQLHNRKEIDPNLLKAREIVAQEQDHRGCPLTAAGFRAGNGDDSLAVACVLIALQEETQ